MCLSPVRATRITYLANILLRQSLSNPFSHARRKTEIPKRTFHVCFGRVYDETTTAYLLRNTRTTCPGRDVILAIGPRSCACIRRIDFDIMHAAMGR